MLTPDSKDIRGKYTIETCGLDRKKLNDRRKAIVSKFVRKLRAIEREFKNQESEDKKAGAIWVCVQDFKADMHDEEEEFLAFRRYVYVHILPSILQQVFSAQ